MSLDGTEEETLDELVDVVTDDRLRMLHTAVVAVVKSYDAAAGTVTVTCPIFRDVPDGEDGYNAEQLPKLQAVPVAFARSRKFSGGTFPLEEGDSGFLICSERSIARWRTGAAPGSPGVLDMHTLDGAVFYPGIFPDSYPSPTAHATDMMIGSEEHAESRIRIKPSGGMEIGDGATKEAARKGDATSNGTILFAFGAGSGAATLAITYTPGDGGPAQVLSPTGGTITLGEKITGGSANVKIVD